MAGTKNATPRGPAMRWVPEVVGIVGRGVGPSIAIRRVAAKHGVSERSVHCAYYRYRNKLAKCRFRDMHCLLSEGEEQEVIEFITALRVYGTPVGRTDIINYVRDLLQRGPQ